MGCSIIQRPRLTIEPEAQARVESDPPAAKAAPGAKFGRSARDLTFAFIGLVSDAREKLAGVS